MTMNHVRTWRQQLFVACVLPVVLTISCHQFVSLREVISRPFRRFQSSSSRMTSDIERFEVATRYSEVVVFNGPTVYLSGQVPENTAGMSAAEQTKDILALIEQRLNAAGSEKGRILTATIYMADLARDYAAMNTVWDEWLPSGTAPARTTVGVTALARADWALEITVTAALKPR